MKRTLFAVIACLALLAALPAVSLARSSEHHRDRDHTRVEHPRHHDRLDRDRDRHRDRVEHFRGDSHRTVVGDAGTVQSFTSGVLTIRLSDGTTVASRVSRRTEVRCEAMDRDIHREDGGPGPIGGGHGGRDHGDRHDRLENRDCLMALETAGTPVADASLNISPAGSLWTVVDLDTVNQHS